MDDLDTKILNIIQTDGRASVKSIAEKCFISAPSASVRLQNLEDSGFIKEYSAEVDYEKLGYSIKAYIRIDVSAKDKEKFVKTVQPIPNVTEVEMITGDASMQVETYFKTMQDLNEFLLKLNNFGDTHTNIVFSTDLGPRPLNLENSK